MIVVCTRFSLNNAGKTEKDCQSKYVKRYNLLSENEKRNKKIKPTLKSVRLIWALTVFEIIKSEGSINKKKRIPLILFKVYK